MGYQGNQSQNAYDIINFFVSPLRRYVSGDFNLSPWPGPWTSSAYWDTDWFMAIATHSSGAKIDYSFGNAANNSNTGASATQPHCTGWSDHCYTIGYHTTP